MPPEDARDSSFLFLSKCQEKICPADYIIPECKSNNTVDLMT
jgi:hypothetical protein